jgi:hypothetical protein
LGGARWLQDSSRRTGSSDDVAEFCDERVVFGASNARTTQAEVERVVAEYVEEEGLG